jgi:tetratricopeptide (TPR) repeat protein
VSRAVAGVLACATLVATLTTGVEAKRSLRMKSAQATDTTRVALPDPVLAPDMPRALAVLDSARVAAAADRHADAIRLYRRAITLYPPLADDIGVEIGNQYTWANEPDSAMAWYQRHLAHHPNDADAIIGAARLTSWRDDGRAERLTQSGRGLDQRRRVWARRKSSTGRPVPRGGGPVARLRRPSRTTSTPARAPCRPPRWMGLNDVAVAMAD